MRPILAAAVAALALAACQKADDAAFNARVRAYLLENPEILLEMQEKFQAKQVAQAEADVKAGQAALPRLRARLERDPRDFVANPNGAITVVEFFDYNCGYCKSTAPEVARLIRENPDVRFVFKEFPIFGGVSDSAAHLAVTPALKPKGLELFEALMSERALDEAALNRHIAALGVNPDAARRAAEGAAVKRHVADTVQLAKELKLAGTPAFIIGDTLIPGADMNAVRAAIVQARAGELKTIG